MVSSISLDKREEQIYEEPVKSNKDIWRSSISTGLSIHDIRELHWKRRSTQGNSDWIASAISPNRYRRIYCRYTLTAYHYSLNISKNYYTYQLARKFCTRCLEVDTHNEQSCINKPNWEVCKKEHATDSCPNIGANEVSHPTGVRLVDDIGDHFSKNDKTQMVEKLLISDENIVDAVPIVTQ